jgi:hypothetical protein
MLSLYYSRLLARASLLIRVDMKITLFTVYKMLFLLLPLPLFFDLASMSLFYVKTVEYNYLFDSPLVPLPIGAISLFCSILVGYTCSIITPSKMISVLPPKKLLIFFLFIVLPVFIYVRFVSGLGLARIAQVMLPMLFLSMLSFPRYIQDRLGVLTFVVLGAALFFGAHLISIVQFSNDLWSPDERLEFSSFYGVLIYQSLVSYPGVLSLYLFLCLAMVYSTKKAGFRFSLHVKSVVWVLPFLLLYLLAASGRRAFLVEFVSGASILFFSGVFFVLGTGKLSRRSGVLLALFCFIVTSFFLLYMFSPLSERVVASIRDNTFDSGRLGILTKAYEFFTNNLDVLLLGAGGTDSPGFHNYVLNQIYRIGLIGFLALYSINGYLVFRFVKTIDTGAKVGYARAVFSLVLLSCLFWQSMINASISQPYYFVNFLVVFMLSFFVVFGQGKDSVDTLKHETSAKVRKSSV